MNNFVNRLGHDNFVWWIGVVEDRFDPLNIGRCKVRIFGSHTDNLQLIPTATLPWAMPLYPVNSSKTFSAPMEGDYVFGFFMDGMSGQSPAMLGVFPAIIQSDISPVGVGFTANAKLTNNPTLVASLTTDQVSSLTPEQAVALTTPNVSSETPAAKPNRKGEPTTPKLTWSIKGTGVERSNNNRVHVCDIANALRYSIAVQKLEAYGVFTTIRTTIEGLTDAASSSPIATQIITAIKTLRGYINMIQKGIDFVNTVVLEIAGFLKYIKDMIAYIVSLPAQLMAMLKKCLDELYAAMTGALNISGTTGILGQVTGLIQDVSKIATSAAQAGAALQMTATTATTLLNPKTYGKA